MLQLNATIDLKALRYLKQNSNRVGSTVSNLRSLSAQFGLVQARTLGTCDNEEGLRTEHVSFYAPTRIEQCEVCVIHCQSSHCSAFYCQGC